MLHKRTVMLYLGLCGSLLYGIPDTPINPIVLAYQKLVAGLQALAASPNFITNDTVERAVSLTTLLTIQTRQLDPSDTSSANVLMNSAINNAAIFTSVASSPIATNSLASTITALSNITSTLSTASTTFIGLDTSLTTSLWQQACLPLANTVTAIANAIIASDPTANSALLNQAAAITTIFTNADANTVPSSTDLSSINTTITNAATGGSGDSGASGASGSTGDSGSSGASGSSGTEQPARAFNLYPVTGASLFTQLLASSRLEHITYAQTPDHFDDDGFAYDANGNRISSTTTYSTPKVYGIIPYSNTLQGVSLNGTADASLQTTTQYGDGTIDKAVIDGNNVIWFTSTNETMYNYDLDAQQTTFSTWTAGQNQLAQSSSFTSTINTNLASFFITYRNGYSVSTSGSQSILALGNPGAIHAITRHANTENIFTIGGITRSDNPTGNVINPCDQIAIDQYNTIWAAKLGTSNLYTIALTMREVSGTFALQSASFTTPSAITNDIVNNENGDYNYTGWIPGPISRDYPSFAQGRKVMALATWQAPRKAVVLTEPYTYNSTSYPYQLCCFSISDQGIMYTKNLNYTSVSPIIATSTDAIWAIANRNILLRCTGGATGVTNIEEIDLSTILQTLTVQNAPLTAIDVKAMTLDNDGNVWISFEEADYLLKFDYTAWQAAQTEQ